MGALSGLKLVKDGHKIKVEQNIKWKLAVGCFICLVKESIDSKILSRCYQWFVEVVSLQRKRQVGLEEYEFGFDIFEISF